MVEVTLLWVSLLYQLTRKLLLLTLWLVPYYLLPYLTLTEYSLYHPTLCVTQVIALKTILGSGSGRVYVPCIFTCYLKLPFHSYLSVAFSLRYPSRLNFSGSSSQFERFSNDLHWKLTKLPHSLPNMPLYARMRHISAMRRVRVSNGITKWKAYFDDKVDRFSMGSILYRISRYQQS